MCQSFTGLKLAGHNDSTNNMVLYIPKQVVRRSLESELRRQDSLSHKTAKNPIILKVSLDQTRHRTRIIKLKPAVTYLQVSCHKLFMYSYHNLNRDTVPSYTRLTRLLEQQNLAIEYGMYCNFSICQSVQNCTVHCFKRVIYCHMHDLSVL